MQPRWLVSCCLLGVACEQEVPCSEVVDPGDRLQVTVLAPWSDPQRTDLVRAVGQPPSCGTSDIVVGETRTIALERGLRGPRGCYLLSCPDDYPTESKPGRGGSLTVRDFLCVNGGRQVRLTDDCMAGRWLALHRIDARQDPFAEPVPGADPPVVLTRTLVYTPKIPGLVCTNPEDAFPAGAEAPPQDFVCTDSWVVRLRRVP